MNGGWLRAAAFTAAVVFVKPCKPRAILGAGRFGLAVIRPQEEVAFDRNRL